MIITSEVRQVNMHLMPEADKQNLAITFLDAVKRFYEIPGNREKYQAWLQTKEANKSC